MPTGCPSHFPWSLQWLSRVNGPDQPFIGGIPASDKRLHEPLCPWVAVGSVGLTCSVAPILPNSFSEKVTLSLLISNYYCTFTALLLHFSKNMSGGFPSSSFLYPIICPFFLVAFPFCLRWYRVLMTQVSHPVGGLLDFVTSASRGWTETAGGPKRGGEGRSGT